VPLENPSHLKAFAWLLRALAGIGGAVLAFVAWPVADGAWHGAPARAEG